MSIICDNPFKKALQGGERLLGLWLALADPYCAEIAATADFDWLMIDGEHGPNDIRSTLSQLQAIAAYRAEPVVRPPMAEAWYIKKLLDIGAKTLLVPMVETPDQAAAIVAATRYPSAGKRGVGASLARASRWNLETEFLDLANESICVLLQVETQLGIANIESIAAVPGVDGIFVGPSDLAADMGLVGQVGHPDVQRAVYDGCSRIAKAGLPAGIFVSDEPSVRRAFDCGCRFVAVGSDASLLARGARTLAAQARGWSAA